MVRWPYLLRACKPSQLFAPATRTHSPEASWRPAVSCHLRSNDAPCPGRALFSLQVERCGQLVARDALDAVAVDGAAELTNLIIEGLEGLIGTAERRSFSIVITAEDRVRWDSPGKEAVRVEGQGRLERIQARSKPSHRQTPAQLNDRITLYNGFADI
jgi:hypothetical protein